MGDYKDLSVVVRITVVSDTCTEPHEGSLGKGVIALLEGIEKTGSLNRAAKGLGMAYSKAWRIVKETEAGFGFTLIDRDGARGSTLTAQGVKLLATYGEILKETTDFANKKLDALLKK
jgi:molybdate transport system regulatory protein